MAANQPGMVASAAGSMIIGAVEGVVSKKISKNIKITSLKTMRKEIS